MASFIHLAFLIALNPLFLFFLHFDHLVPDFLLLAHIFLLDLGDNLFILRFLLADGLIILFFLLQHRVSYRLYVPLDLLLYLLVFLLVFIGLVHPPQVGSVQRSQVLFPLSLHFFVQSQHVLVLDCLRSGFFVLHLEHLESSFHHVDLALGFFEFLEGHKSIELLLGLSVAGRGAAHSR